MSKSQLGEVAAVLGMGALATALIGAIFAVILLPGGETLTRDQFARWCAWTLGTQAALAVVTYLVAQQKRDS